MKVGDQDLAYVIRLVGVFEDSLTEKLGVAFAFSFLIFGPIIIAAITYYYNSTLGGPGPYLLGMSLFGVYYYRRISKAMPLPLEFKKHEILLAYRNGKEVVIAKNGLNSASIKPFKGGYILVLVHGEETAEIVMNHGLRKEFMRNA